VINYGDAATTSSSVTLFLTANDQTSGVSQVRYSNNAEWDKEPWEDFAPTKLWALTPEEGPKTVYYQIIDNAGHISTTYFDTIILESTSTAAPEITPAPTTPAPTTPTPTTELPPEPTPTPLPELDPSFDAPPSESHSPAPTPKSGLILPPETFYAVAIIIIVIIAAIAIIILKKQKR
jgi:hypothetical protein